MRKTATAVFALLLTLALLATSGCGLFGSAMTDANNAIEEGNVHLRKFRESEDRYKKVQTELNSLNALTSEEASKAIDLVAKIREELGVQRSELAAASKEIAKVKTYDVDATFKKYADLEIAAISAQIAVVDEADKLYVEMNRLYTAIRDKKNSTALSNEIMTNVDTHTANLSTLTQTAAKAKDEADAYFQKTATEK